MRRLIGLGAVAALGLTAMATTAGAKEEKIALEKVPAAVMDAVKAKYPGAELKGAEKEEEDGKTVYEVKLTHAGEKYEVELKADGTLIAVEKEIPVSALPAAVTKALKDKYPGAKLEDAEEVTKDGKVTYEVEVETKDDKEFEVTLDAKGKILETEEKKDEKDEKK